MLARPGLGGMAQLACDYLDRASNLCWTAAEIPHVARYTHPKARCECYRVHCAPLLQACSIDRASIWQANVNNMTPNVRPSPLVSKLVS